MEGSLKAHRPPKTVWATHCPKCRRPVRPHNAPEHLWPDTVMAENTTGLCGSCASRARVKARAAGVKPPVPVRPAGLKLPLEVRQRLSLENTIAGLNRMLQRRHARGVPVEGWLGDEDES